MVFRELPFKEDKNKAEVVDQEAKALKIGPYKPKNPEKRTNSSTPSTSNKNQNSSKPSKPSKPNKDKDKPCKDQLKKEGKCYECLEKGHLAKDCPKKKKKEKDMNSPELNAISADKDLKSTPESPESNSIRLPKPTINSKKDGRSYCEVASGVRKSESP